MADEECFCRLPQDRSESPPTPADWTGARLRAARRSALARSRTWDAPDVTALLLDMGGVVIPTLFESVIVPGFPAGPLGSDAAYKAVEHGELNERDYWATLQEQRPDLDVGALWRSCSHVRDEIREAVHVLAGRVKLVAFTNDMTHWFGETWAQDFPELSAFHDILDAARLGVGKPDPEAFRRAAEAISEPPEQCLFVDDLEVNIAGAAAVGMQTLLFDVRKPRAAVEQLLARLGTKACDSQTGSRVFRLPR